MSFAPTMAQINVGVLDEDDVGEEERRKWEWECVYIFVRGRASQRHIALVMSPMANTSTRSFHASERDNSA